jgi:hypothetical protein
MKTANFVGAVLSVLVIASNSRAVDIATVPVGNLGNLPDITGIGAVSNAYRIGKYEVTNGEYAAFLNAVGVTDTYGLYNSFMATEAQGGIVQSGSSGSYSYSVKSGQSDMPVVFVSFWDRDKICKLAAQWTASWSSNDSYDRGWRVHIERLYQLRRRVHQSERWCKMVLTDRG